MTTVRIKAMLSFNPCTHTLVLYKDSMLQWPVFSGILNGLLSETSALGFIAVFWCFTSSNEPHFLPENLFTSNFK